MTTRNLSNQLLLVAFVGICSLGCQVSSSAGSGGSSGSGAGGAAGSSSGSGGNSSGSGGDSSGAGGATSPSGGGGSTATTSVGNFDPTKLPCDIYAQDNGPCVAAHSTVRRLSSSYTGPLYQIRIGGSNTGTGGSTADIGTTDNGLADSGAQDSACGSSSCTISIIYDQSGNHNDLVHTAAGGGAKPTADNEAKATAISLTLGSQKVYGVHIAPGIGYRNNKPTGTATGDNAETEYMVVSGSYFNGGCCFDYGNMETNSHDNGEGTMEAVYFGNCTIWNKGDGDGPWVMGDLENGLWAGNTSPYTNNKTLSYKYVTGIVKGDAAGKNHWAIKTGDATSGTLTVPFDGPRPSARYNPMRKEGAIGLGTGGDNSNGAQGNFFEGIMTATYSSNEADNAVQANIVSVYSQQQ